MNPQIEAWFRVRVHNPRTLERFLKANAAATEMDMIRGGWRPSAPLRNRGMSLPIIRKGECVRRYGRRVWAMIPANAKLRDGRREAAPLIVVESLATVQLGREAEAAAILRRQYPSPGKRFYSLEDMNAWRELCQP